MAELRFWHVALLAVMLAGCGTAEVAGENGAIRVLEDARPAGAPVAKYAATIRLLPYTDGRDADNPRSPWPLSGSLNL